MNTYVKLFLIGRTDGLPYILLYGYGVPDLENDVRGWSKNILSKNLGLYQMVCVMSQEGMKDFEEKLLTEEVQITNDISITGNLRKRPETLFYPKKELGRNDGSLLKSLSRVREYWNIEKECLFENIQEKYKERDATEQRNKINEVLEILSRETSICFLGNAAERLGNIEIYDPCKECKDFEWSLDTNNKKILLVKKNLNREVLIVNCILCNADRVVFNNVAEWTPDVPSLEFEVSEIISEVHISVWQKEQGQLIFYDKSYIYRLQVDMQIKSNICYKINDRWTKHLLKTFGGSSQKEEKLNRVRIKQKNDTYMGNVYKEERNIWEDASYTGIQLAKKYVKTKSKGAYCKKIGEGDCEIDSFLKIAEYFNNRDVEKAIIVDPYFSVFAMEKMLTRITNEKMYLKIITSLSLRNPDKEGASEINPNYLGEVRDFLKNNKRLIHKNLMIQNITHQGNTVIHDRYLLLKKTNSIEGYLLSNSINSAGQNYSFVIAPMDQEVVYEVLDYVHEITDEEIQSRKNKKIRYQIETLWDSESNKKEEENTSFIIVNPWERKDEKIKLNELFPRGWDLNEEVAEESILSLCWHLYYRRGLKVRNCIEWMKRNKINLQKFVEYGFKAAQKLEVEEKLYEINKVNYSYVNMFRMALDVQKQEEMILDVEYIMNDTKEIYYDRYSYLYILYRMTFYIDVKKTIEFMQKVQSPMAFKVIKENMLKGEYRLEIYQNLQNSKLQWLSRLSYYYFVFVLLERIKQQEKPWSLPVENYLDSHPKTAVFQYACWIKVLTFKQRNNPNIKMLNIIDICFSKISEYLYEVNFTEEDQRMFASFLKSEDGSVDSKNIMRLWEMVKLESWRTFIQQWGIHQLEEKWSNNEYTFYKTDFDVTKCAAFMALQLWKDDIESMLVSLKLNEKALYRAICPVEYDINYDLWRKSVQKVLWQLLFLKYYCEFWKKEEDVMDAQYQKLIDFRNALYKIKMQCERWYDFSGLVTEVFTKE